MHAPPSELHLLKEFEESVGDWFAPEFELCEFGSDDGGYPLTADRLRVFALATGSGSTYAIWLLDDRADLSTLPVVFLGDEGGVHLVAPDFREFLRVLASGWTPQGGWDGLRYHDERDDDPLPAHAQFRDFLRRRFGIEAAENPNDVVTSTEGLLWDRFAEWIGPLYPDVVNSRTTR